MSDNMITNDALESGEQGSPKARSRHNLIYGCIALLALMQLAVVGFLGWQWMQSAQTDVNAESDFYATELEALSEQIEALHQRVAALETASEMSGNHSGMLDRYNLQQQSLQELQEELNTLKTKLEERSVETIGPMPEFGVGRNAQLAKEIETLRGDMEQQGQKRWQELQMLIAFDRLEEQILQEEPYDKALAAFQLASEGLTQSQSWMQQLRPFALEGIAGWKALQSQFDAAREAVLGAEMTDSQEQGVWSGIRDNVSKLVKIRKTGPAHQGNDVQAILARAEFALIQQDAEGTLHELSALSESERKIFSDFSEALNGRLQVLSVIPEIRDYLLARVGQTGE